MPTSDHSLTPMPFTIPWISRQRLYTLSRIEPFEVSGVDHGANRRRFLVIKREDNPMQTNTDPHADMNTTGAARAAISERLCKALQGFTGLVERWSTDALSPDDLEAELRKHFAALGVHVEPVAKNAAAAAAEPAPAVPAAEPAPTPVPAAPVAAAEPPPAPAADAPTMPPLAPVVPITAAASAAPATPEPTAPTAAEPTAPTAPTAPDAPSLAPETAAVVEALQKSLEQGAALLAKLQAPAPAPTAPAASDMAAALAPLLALHKQQLAEAAATRAILTKRLAEPAPPASVRPEAEPPRGPKTFDADDYNDGGARRRFLGDSSSLLGGPAS